MAHDICADLYRIFRHGCDAYEPHLMKTAVAFSIIIFFDY